MDHSTLEEEKEEEEFITSGDWRGKHNSLSRGAGAGGGGGGGGGGGIYSESYMRQARFLRRRRSSIPSVTGEAKKNF